MPAIKSGNEIYIIGPGETTLADVVIGINDVTWFIYKGSGIYALLANHKINVRDEGTLIIGDKNDFSVFEGLDFEASGDNHLSIIVQNGGTFKQYGNSYIDYAAGVNHYYSGGSSFNGNLIIDGNITYRPIWKGVFIIKILARDFLIPSIINVKWLYITLRAPSLGGGILPFTIQGVLNDDVIFENCIFEGNPEWTPGQGRGRVPYLEDITSATDWRIVLKNCEIRYFDAVSFIAPQLRWLNCNFHDNDTLGTLIRMPFSQIATWATPSPWEDRESYVSWGQNFALVEGCTFVDNIGTIDILITSGSIILFKDCDFLDSSFNIRIQQNSTALLWTGNTFAGDFSVLSANFFAYVFSLKITITDTDDIPIPNAIVRVKQKDDKESWQFFTDSNGEINGHPLLDSQVMCIHKVWVSGDPVTGVFEFWSDDSNSTYHIVEVSAFGYITKQEQIVMDQDKEITIKLAIGVSPPPVKAKVLHLTSGYTS
jgi:hypothetical protein